MSTNSEGTTAFQFLDIHGTEVRATEIVKIEPATGGETTYKVVYYRTPSGPMEYSDITLEVRNQLDRELATHLNARANAHA